MGRCRIPISQSPDSQNPDRVEYWAYLKWSPTSVMEITESKTGWCQTRGQCKKDWVVSRKEVKLRRLVAEDEVKTVTPAAARGCESAPTVPALGSPIWTRLAVAPSATFLFAQ